MSGKLLNHVVLLPNIHFALHIADTTHITKGLFNTHITQQVYSTHISHNRSIQHTHHTTGLFNTHITQQVYCRGPLDDAHLHEELPLRQQRLRLRPLTHRRLERIREEYFKRIVMDRNKDHYQGSNLGTCGEIDVCSDIYSAWFR